LDCHHKHKNGRCQVARFSIEQVLRAPS
jgi:hypothetical protein